jgi:hypothetical protein
MGGWRSSVAWWIDGDVVVRDMGIHSTIHFLLKKFFTEIGPSYWALQL